MPLQTRHEGKPDRSPSPMRLFSSQELEYIDDSSMDEFLESRSSRTSRDRHSEMSVHAAGSGSPAGFKTITAHVEQDHNML